MQTPHMLITLGGLLLLSLVTHFIGKNTRLPRVTLLILLGYVLGADVLKFIPPAIDHIFQPITTIALAMVGFILGGQLTLSSLKKIGHLVVILSVTVVLLTFAIVSLGLYLLGVDLPMAMLLGCAACATDPASTIDVIKEMQSKGLFTNVLVDIVAIDDAWALILFSLVLAVVTLTGSGQQTLLSSAYLAFWDIVGAIGLGGLLGIPAAYLSGRIRPGEMILVEALGLILLCAGLAELIHVSYLMAAMTLGFVITNLAKHHTRPFHAIENISTPFMMIFFMLAGASLSAPDIFTATTILAGYLVLRVMGKMAGGYLGARWAKIEPKFQKWAGLALLPQAGVAIGMVLVITQQYPDSNSYMLPVVLGSTIIFEIIGPIFTRKAIEATA